MSKLPNLISWAQGKKTYIIILVGVALGIMEHYNVPVPWWGNLALLALGGGALRSGVTSEASKSADDIAALINTIMASVQVPVTPQTVQLSSGKTITLGKPSPVDQGDAQEKSETKDLNLQVNGLKP